MQRLWLGVVAACGAALLAGGPAPAQEGRLARRAVLISLDGFGAANLADARIPLPNLRRLAAEGAQAEAMTVSTPSVTWPNHTTLVTGLHPARHGVLANGMIEPSSVGAPRVINPRRSKLELTPATTLYDAAKAAGLTTAEINWPVTRGAPTLDWSFPDHPDPLRYTTPALLQELQLAGILTEPSDAAFRQRGSLARDEIWTQAAVRTLRRLRPHLLLLHLLLTDGTQHTHGPGTPEAHAALALADRWVGDVLGGLEKAELTGETAVFVTADHGFARVTHQVHPNARLRREGLIRGTGDAAEYSAQSIAEGGLALVYVPRARLEPELVARTRRALTGLEGVEQVLDADQFTQLGMPAPGRSPQAPDLVLTARDGFAFGNNVTGDEVVALARPIGSHGYAHTNPKMDALFVAAGPGVRRGARLGRIRNVDVAPTLARILGLTLPETDGQVLAGLLAAP